MNDPAAYVKSMPGAEKGEVATEVAGLAWLAHAGGANVVGVRSFTDDSLTLDLLPAGSPTTETAMQFGRDLATTHNAGAPHFGALPPDAKPRKKHTWIGKAELPVGKADTWGLFYAAFRIAPYVDKLQRSGLFVRQDVKLFNDVSRRLADGDPALCGPAEPVARIHGDLWGGNVVWSEGGAGWLIDPAAHGGHRETDLAMLALFGGSFVDSVIAGYQQASPLAPGWQQRVPVHQLHPLLVHAVLFGASYAEQAIATARRLA